MRLKAIVPFGLDQIVLPQLWIDAQSDYDSRHDEPITVTLWDSQGGETGMSNLLVTKLRRALAYVMHRQRPYLSDTTRHIGQDGLNAADGRDEQALERYIASLEAFRKAVGVVVFGYSDGAALGNGVDLSQGRTISAEHIAYLQQMDEAITAPDQWDIRTYWGED